MEKVTKFPEGDPWDTEAKADGKRAEDGDRSIAAMAIAPSSTDAKSGATSAHGAASGFAEVNLTMTTSAYTARKRKRRKTRKETTNEE